MCSIKYHKNDGDDTPDSAVIVAHKREGETMGQFIARVKAEENDRRGTAGDTYTFVGRLDPLASGVVPVCLGDAIETKSAIFEYPKKYEVSVLCGLGTDTGDPLGIISEVSQAALDTVQDHQEHNLDEEKVKKELASLVGIHHQPYPKYSSKPYKGKPLWMWSREGAHLDESASDYPCIDITLFDLQLIHIETMGLSNVKDVFAQRLQAVTSDYRQKDVLARWDEVVRGHEDTKIPLISIEVLCSSGTYMRWLAPKLAKVLGYADGLAWKIVRKSVGPYK